MQNYNNTSLTPLKVITISYTFITIFLIILFFFGFYENSKYFTWGIPVTLFHKEIDDNIEFYTLLFLFFVNKIMNTLITEVVYSWILNNIHDPKSNNTFYSKNISLSIILLNSLHLSINSMFSINGTNAQISFLIAESFGNLLVIFYINKRFIERIENNKDNLNYQLLSE